MRAWLASCGSATTSWRAANPTWGGLSFCKWYNFATLAALHLWQCGIQKAIWPLPKLINQLLFGGYRGFRREFCTRALARINPAGIILQNCLISTLIVCPMPVSGQFNCNIENGNWNQLHAVIGDGAAILYVNGNRLATEPAFIDGGKPGLSDSITFSKYPEFSGDIITQDTQQLTKYLTQNKRPKRRRPPHRRRARRPGRGRGRLRRLRGGHRQEHTIWFCAIKNSFGHVEPKVTGL